MPRKKTQPAPGPAADWTGDPMALLIRRAWCHEYRNWVSLRTGFESDYGKDPIPQWDGGYRPRDGAPCGPVWPRIADHCRRAGLDPVCLVRSAFHGRDGSGPAPVPTLIVNAVPAAYRTLLESVAHRRTQQRRSFDATLDHHLARGRPLEAILRDRTVELNDLYRYARAAEGRLRGLAAELEDAALALYCYDRPAFDEGWSDLIPNRLRRLADARSGVVETEADKD